MGMDMKLDMDTGMDMDISANRKCPGREIDFGI